jgi:PAS domain S-box-containing protein
LRQVAGAEPFLQSGAIEILDEQWYLENGEFDPARNIADLQAKLSRALVAGYAGMRAHGNEAWLKEAQWHDFLEYENSLNGVLGGHRIIVLCTYPLLERSGADVFDVAHAHEFAVAKRAGKWDVLETSELKRHKRDLMRFLVDAIPQQIWSAPPDGVVDYCNLRWRSYMGLTLEELQRDGWQTMLHPDDRDRVVNAWRESVLTGTPYEQEERHRGADGAYRWFLSRGVPLRDSDGRVIRWYGTNTDIEGRKQAEEELRQTEVRFRNTIETLPVAVYLCDRNGMIQAYNAMAAELWGRRPTIGEPADRYCAAFRHFRADGSPFALKDSPMAETLRTGVAWRNLELTLEAADGCRRQVIVNISPLRDDQGEVIGAINCFLDMTERQRALAALQESEHRFREVTESIDEVFWLKDVATNEIVYVSPAYEKVWGRSRASLFEAHQTWLNAVHPEDFDRVRAAAAKQRAVHYDLEYRIIRPDGSICWIHDRAFPIRNSEGEVYRIAGVADDITAHRQLEQQLRQSQKMEAIGQLSGGIAHDFNNMLAVIQMNSSLLLNMEQLSPRVSASIQDIMAAAERAGNLTRQLLTFSRREVKQARNLDLTEVIDAMLKLLRRIVGEDIAFETRFVSPLPMVHADVSMIEQIIMNLVVNARDAMPHGGRLSVSLAPVEVSAAQTAAHPGVAPGRFVCLAVSDTGAGIPPENLTRIFEPFFTTKEVGKGTGLGLATVFGIAEQHGGWVEVESEVGRGATFRVHLPAVSADEVSAAERAALDAGPRGGHETILFVEDEPSLQAIARVVLEQHGYTVFTASSAAAALELWQEKRAGVDLLLTDLVMPGGISGRELADRLVQDKPALKVIYASGYSNEIVSRHLHLDQGRTFLQKPFSSVGLLEAVRRCLDESRD